jgi:hypothetical protein
MYRLDAAVTHAINGLAGTSFIIDFLMIRISGIGVPVLVPAGRLALRTDESANAARDGRVLLLREQP